jgi:hypothetical protein
MIGLESRPRRREQILTQQASDTLVLFNLDEGQYYALDEVGGKIWQLCDGSQSVLLMISKISEEYDAPSRVVEDDVLELLRELASERLVAEGE